MAESVGLQQREVDLGSLHAREQGFLALAEAMPHLVWSALPDGRIDYFNRRWLVYTGLSVEDAAGRGVKNVVHPDDVEDTWKHWDEAIQTGKPYEIEFRLRRNVDNTYHWFLGRVVPLRGGGGKVVRWVGTATDIDNQKQAEYRERHIAQTLQEASLPPIITKLNGLSLDAIYIAANKESEIGGDWYDAIELDDGRVVVGVGDVVGKGLSAAVIMSKMRHAMAVVPLYEKDPTKILDAAGWLLRKRYPEAIVTAFVAIISADRKCVDYANAGHPFPLLRRGETIEELGAIGLPLGLRYMHPPHKSSRREVLPGDILTFYTDGLTEWGYDWVEGERCLRNAVASKEFAQQATPAHYLASACAAQPYRDDVAILTVSFLGGR